MLNWPAFRQVKRRKQRKPEGEAPTTLIEVAHKRRPCASVEFKKADYMPERLPRVGFVTGK